MSFSLDVIFYTPFIFVGLYLLINLLARTPRNVCIVVLGDIGRSPRMQYHALSFAKEGFRVYLVGYNDTTPHRDIIQNDNILIHHVRKPPALFNYMPRLLQYFLKVIWQSVTLMFTLILLPKMSSILLQNPPSIPTMAVCYMACWVRFCELVIDWHNYGHTILALALRKSHPLVRFSKWYERVCGRLAAYNLCVTEAMKEDLFTNWSISAVTLYDRPPEIFQPVSLEKQHDLFVRLNREYPVFNSRDNTDTSCTRFTKRHNDGKVTKVANRPAVLVSSTSWTEDEDFSILLKALIDYDAMAQIDENLPNIVCVITGKGPQKQFYQNEIKGREWKRVDFCLPWLAAEDYPLLLASADLGVCLHMSSSGLDLPMKVVDMFGCGLPVCAVSFSCIDELVKHDTNGLIFHDGKQLVQQIKSLLHGFPTKRSKLEVYRSNLEAFQKVRWHEQWCQLVLPIFKVIGAADLQEPKMTNISGISKDISWDEDKESKTYERKKDD